MLGSCPDIKCGIHLMDAPCGSFYTLGRYERLEMEWDKKHKKKKNMIKTLKWPSRVSVPPFHPTAEVNFHRWS